MSAGLLLGGCANWDSIYHERAVKPDALAHVVTVDAKQRHLLVNPERNIASSEVTLRMCAEAAPDVFSAYATSLGAKGGVKDRDVSAELSLSRGETAATIERTQTINMLRESMYRTCERYLSGAISRTTFITQAARDQRSMIAFLAIEQLTRAARPPSTIISGPPTSAAIKDGESAAKLVEAFRQDAATASAAETSAQSDFDAKDKGVDCKTKETPPEGDDAAAQKKKDDFAKCMAAKALLAVKQAENKVAQERLGQALKLAGDTVTSINAATQAGANNAGQGGGTLNAQTAAVISDAVVKITTAATINESLMFCIGYLGDHSLPLDPRLVDKCIDVIANNAKSDQTLLNGLLKFEAAGVGWTVSSYSPAIDEATRIVRAYLFDTSLADPERKRRHDLVAQAALSLHFISDARDLTNFIVSDNVAAMTLLLARLRSDDQTTAGRAALGTPKKKEIK